MQQAEHPPGNGEQARRKMKAETEPGKTSGRNDTRETKTRGVGLR